MTIEKLNMVQEIEVHMDGSKIFKLNDNNEEKIDDTLTEIPIRDRRMSLVERDPLLVESTKKYTLFPIEQPLIWEYYQSAMQCFWTTGELDFEQDIDHWNNKLNGDEKFFLTRVFAFFASSDGIVNENLAQRFMSEIQVCH